MNARLTFMRWQCCVRALCVLSPPIASFPLNLLSAQPFDEAASAAHAAFYEESLEPMERYAPFACGGRRAGRHFCVGGSSLASPHDHTVVLYARFRPQQIRLLKRCQLQARTPNDSLP